MEPKRVNSWGTKVGRRSGRRDANGLRAVDYLKPERKNIRVFIVVDRLPLKWTKDEEGRHVPVWMDDTVVDVEDHTLPERVHSLSDVDYTYHYIGRPNFYVPEKERDQVREVLAEKNCTPIFMDQELWSSYYKGYCKSILWPVFHSIIDIYTTSRVVLEETAEPMPEGAWTPKMQERLWHGYCQANRMFADAVLSCYSEGDIVWIHGYHLLLVPSFIARKMPTVNMGMFLHIPFPTSAIFRTLSMRKELLRGMLNVDHIGFHLFSYARNFLSCCRRLLGLEYQSSMDGLLGVDYYGRRVTITCSHAAVTPRTIDKLVASSNLRDLVAEKRKKYGKKIVIAGCDSIERLKGIPVKMIAFHQLLLRQPQWVGKVVFVQIGLHADARDKDYVNSKDEIKELARQINAKFQAQAGGPLVYFYEEDTISTSERLALWRVADVYFNTALREGFNPCSFEYIVAHRQPAGAVILSEFSTASRVLSGAMRINPWEIESTVDTLSQTLAMSASEREARRAKDMKYIISNRPEIWAKRIVQDIRNARKKEDKYVYMGTGFGLEFRVLELGQEFQKLEPNVVAAAYRKSNRRTLIFDYYGTLVPMRAVNSGEDWPDVPPRILTALEHLCKDPRNTVFVISSVGRELLAEKFASVPGLGLAAEHGYFLKLAKRGTAARLDKPWELSDPSLARVNNGWKELVISLMEQFVERTNGAELEVKESAVLFRFEATDPEFGQVQGKELAHSLVGLLENWPLQVITGKKYVEVRPQNVGAQHFLKRVLREIESSTGGSPDFILCVGDDKGDEEMFDFVESYAAKDSHDRNLQHFTITVGRKPSKAHYYVDSTEEVGGLLAALDTCSLKSNRNYSANDLQVMAAKLPSIKGISSVTEAVSRFARKRSSSSLSSLRGGNLEPVIEEQEQLSSDDQHSRRMQRQNQEEGETPSWVETLLFWAKMFGYMGVSLVAIIAYRRALAQKRQRLVAHQSNVV